MRATFAKRTIAWAFLLAVAASSGPAEVQVDKMFSDHMVLQRDLAVPIWGTADPGEKVTITFRGQQRQTEADKDGKWLVRLDPLKVGEPGRLTVSGGNSVTFSDVLVGDVWVGSGQSNMAGSTGGYAKRDEVLAAMVKAAPYPRLRLYRGGWKESTAQNINGFSAILFAFGQPLQKELDVPVGLIVGAVGGTPSGRWLSPEMLAADPACQAAFKKSGAGSLEERQQKHRQALAEWQKAAKLAKDQGKRAPRRPRGPIKVGDLYAAHIEPVVPYAIRGALWDQGESGTAVREIDQFTMMGALIKGWRNVWGQGDFPFLYVQKPSGGGCAWDPKGDPVTRLANPFAEQPAAANKDRDGLYRELHIRIMQHPNTAMVTASDLGSGVHPVNKSGYGARACRVALGFVYDRDAGTCGPIYDSHKVEGKTIRVRFKHADKGLAFRHGEKLQGFEIAGSDGAYQWADARIDGEAVIVSSPNVAKPAAVRYGWSRNHPWANLFNKAGLPALAFRTDK
jgi:sialate O-acetylesterase